MTVDSELTKNVIKVICFLSWINEIMKQPLLISVNIEFTKITLLKNAMWHVYRSVITATSTIESLVSGTPRSGTKFGLNTLVRLRWSTLSS